MSELALNSMNSIKNGQKNKKSGGICCYTAPLVYVNMPKSACTTIKNLMYYIDNGVEYHAPLFIHRDKKSLLKPTSPDQAAYRKAMNSRKITFTFVREPFSRSYSAFNEKFFHVSQFSFPRPRAILIERYGASFPDEPDRYTARNHANNFLCFLRFVRDTLSADAPFCADAHWAPQCRVIDRHRRFLSLDFIGRVEKFEIGMKYVLAAAGVTRNINLAIRYNEGPPAPYSLKEIMNEEIFALLMIIYRRDVNQLEYWEEVAKLRPV